MYRSGLMVSVLILGSSRLGSSHLGLSPGRGHCVVFLGRTLNSHCASLHKGVYMDTDKLNAGVNPVMDYSLASHPGRSRNIPSRFMLQKLG